MALTLEKIAKMAGVSRSTVSRVVNDQPNVSDEVRERVLQVVRKTGYQPNAAARSLVTRRTRIISIIIPESVTTLFADPFFPLLLKGVTETCNAHHYFLMLSLFDSSVDPDEMYRRVIGSGHLDGLIVASTHMGDPILAKLVEDDVPFVMVGRLPDAEVNYVDVDNIAAARMAMEHLIRLGHRRIGTIAGPQNMIAGLDRHAGYESALKAHRIPVRQELIYEGDFGEDSGRRGVQHLLAAEPTAIFAANDLMAIGALKALREANLRVPQDIALIGFDDIPMASMVQPALTTVRQSIEVLGAMAAELLVSLLEQQPRQEKAPTQRLVLPAELVIRDSCGAMR